MNELPRGIKGLTDSLQYPRAGKIRIGEKANKGMPTEHPVMLDHYRFDDAPGVEAVYGSNCREIKIMFPSDELIEVVDVAYKRYGADHRWKCRGDGVVAVDREKDDEIECLGEDCPAFQGGKCKHCISIWVLLPEVPGGALSVYQIDSSGRRTIRNIMAQIKILQGYFGGIKGIPLKLIVEPYESPYQDKDGKWHTNIKQCFRMELVDVSLLDVHRFKVQGGELPSLVDEHPGDEFYPRSMREAELQALPAPVELVENPTPPETLKDPEVADDWTPPAKPEIPENITEGFSVLGIPEEERQAIIDKFEGDFDALYAEINRRVTLRDHGNGKNKASKTKPAPATQKKEAFF